MRPGVMAETKRNMTPSWLPPPNMARITSKRPPATSTVSNLSPLTFLTFYSDSTVNMVETPKQVHKIVLKIHLVRFKTP